MWRGRFPDHPHPQEGAKVRHRELDPPRSFWRVVAIPDNEADVRYIADRIAKLAGVDSVMIEERRITDLWQEPDEDDSGGGTAG
jgi:hypothetical protein